MAFTEINFMEPLRAFLEAYPALGSGEKLTIDYLDIDPRNPEGPVGNAVAVVGGTSSKAGDVLGGIVRDYQVDLILSLRRHTNSSASRRSLGDFLVNYRMWIDYEEDMRGTAAEHNLLPRFGDTQQESISASGGTQTGIALKPGVDEYSIQLNIRFQKMREPEPY